MTELNESTLHAWFDGELPPEQAAEVEALLRADSGRAAQARLWRADREALRAQLDATLHEPVPPRLAQTVTQDRAPRWRAGLWAAGIAGVFALGGAAGWLAAGIGGGTQAERAATGEWLQRAAVAHAVYVPEMRHPVEVSLEQNQDGHLARWLTKRLDVPIKLFDLKAQGFELVGGRLLPDAKGPSAQLMYQDAQGRRVTCYLRRADSGPADPALAAFRYERRGELGLFYWVEGQGAAATGYALVGDLPREQLLALATAISEQ
jgi:anti-sigma factor RsiW